MLAGVKLDDMEKFRHDLMVADLPEKPVGVESSTVVVHKRHGLWFKFVQLK